MGAFGGCAAVKTMEKMCAAVFLLMCCLDATKGMATMNDKDMFDQIIEGSIPSHKLYEDDQVYSYLESDNPLAKGHTIIVPKQRFKTLDELPDDTAAAVGKVLPRIAAAVMKATGTNDYNLVQNNGQVAHQAMPHVHFHIIPKPSQEEGLKLGWSTTLKDTLQKKRESPQMAERIKMAMASAAATKQQQQQQNFFEQQQQQQQQQAQAGANMMNMGN